jgi:translation elongation factor EF-Tu-like GTPase
MSELTNIQLPNPELEAEIYYLTEQEGGRKKQGIRNGAIATDYRGQFFYDNHNFDAAQQFVGKEWCELGDTVTVLIQTANPEWHVGKFFIGKEFEIREGAIIVGRGKVTKIINPDFNMQPHNTQL